VELVGCFSAGVVPGAGRDAAGVHEGGLAAEGLAGFAVAGGRHCCWRCWCSVRVDATGVEVLLQVGGGDSDLVGDAIGAESSVVYELEEVFGVNAQQGSDLVRCIELPLTGHSCRD